MNFLGNNSGSLIGAASGIVNGIGANRRQKKAIEAQQKENQLARNWQEKMYKQQVLDARKNLQDERAYNNPAAQLNRLRAAGLNPDLMYGNGASGLVDSNVADSASTGVVPPSDFASAIMSSPTFAESLMTGISAMRELAQTKNINADTAKKTGELTSIDLDNVVKAATQGSTIDLQNMQVSLSRSVLNLNEAQKANLSQKLNNLKTENDKMNVEIDHILASKESITSETLNRRILVAIEQGKLDISAKQLVQNLKESDSRINLNNTQAKEMLLLMLSKKLNIDVDTLYKRSGVGLNKANSALVERKTNLVDIQGKQLSFDYKLNTEYSEMERQLGMFTSTMNTLNGFFKNVLSTAFLFP